MISKLLAATVPLSSGVTAVDFLRVAVHFAVKVFAPSSPLVTAESMFPSRLYALTSYRSG